MSSRIPYPFIPIPRIFFKNGFLDHRKENYDRRLRFVMVTFSNCYAVARMVNGVLYDAYEFSCTYEDIAQQIDANPREVKYLFNICIDLGFMIKTPNRIRNRENFFKWDVNQFVCEKVVILDESMRNSEEKVSDQNLAQDSVHNSKKCPTVYRDKIDKKCPTKNDDKKLSENEKSVRPSKKVSDQLSDRLLSENEEKVSDQCTPSLRTKEALCLKETNINKEKVADQKQGQHLSLFHEEKDLFSASRENELAEHQKALEAYISYRDITRITSKTIARWLISYPIEDIQEAIGLMLSSNKHVANPGGWIESALQKGVVRKERVKKQNIAFAKEMQPKNKYLRINSRYCQDIRFREKEFYYHIDPHIFQSELRKCL